MRKYVEMVNPNNGCIKTIKVGLSWVYFFFGGWATLFQGRWIFLFAEIGLEFLSAVTGGALAFALAVFHVYMFIWGNKGYIKYLRSKGWTPNSDADNEILRRI